MSKFTRSLFYGLLVSCLAVMPMSVFGEDSTSESTKEFMTEEQPMTDSTLPHVEQTSGRFRFGVYYGRPYYYRPYYYYYPYRPYYRHHYYPYRPYYGW